MHIFLFVLAIILLIGLVLIHEWGHLIVARRNGIDAEEFGLFFPPKLAAKKLKSGLILSFNLLPLGGFVRLKGEHDADTRAGSFGAASLRAKTKVMLAGVGMNLAVGLILLMILGWVGMPVLIQKNYNGQSQFSVASDSHVIRQEVEVGYILAGSPADKAGLKSTDRFISIGSGGRTVSVHSVEQLRAATKSFAGQRVFINYSQDGQLKQTTAQLLGAKTVAASLKTNDPKGYLGTESSQLTVTRSTWSAPIQAVGLAGQIIWLTLQGIGHALGGLGSAIAGLVSGNHTAREAGQAQASSQVGGPVAVMQILWGSGSLGINFVLALIAIISITLALVNVFPIPALDGGRLAMILIARGVTKRALAQKTEERLVGIGYIAILALIILVTIADVNRG